MKIYYTNQFKKDYKRVKKQHKDITKLRTVIDKLAAQKLLDVKYKDHPLTGKWQGYRDCHLEPDWILIYKSAKNVLILERTGSHSELFKK